MKNRPCYWMAALTLSLGTAACIHAASTLQFVASSYTVAESAGVVTLSVQRTNDPNNARLERAQGRGSRDSSAHNGSTFSMDT